MDEQRTDLSPEALPRLQEMIENGQGVSRALALDLIAEIRRLQSELANAKVHAEIKGASAVYPLEDYEQQ